jgi:hypothetical protein
VSTCFNCGQEMPSVLDFTNVAAMRTALSASYICWEALDAGDSFTIPGLDGPVTASVVAAETQSDYDSYGDAAGSGFVVFQITEDPRGKTATYKIEGTQSSYGGWDWDEECTVKVNAVPKTITLWEREN